MTDSQPWTIKRLLDWTKDYFAKHGSESPRLEAEVLLAESLGCGRIDLYTRFDEVPVEPALGIFRGWVRRRVTGEPVAYLVGHREFYSLRFKVNSDVLIPRPETEHAVLAAIDCAKSLDRPLTVADVGTGSGCIAVTLCKQIPDCRMVAIDISPAALGVAAENASAHGVQDRIEFVESNLFESVPAGQFDLIVSNPPYIGTAEVNTVAQDVREHEPHIALFSGERGTSAIAGLIEACERRLLAGGFLIFETSPLIVDECVKLAEESNLFAEISTIKDYAGQPRIVVAGKNTETS